MNMLLLILLLFSAISTAEGRSPLSLDLKTDKEDYEYGDIIVVKITLTNNSDRSNSIWDSSDPLPIIQPVRSRKSDV
ncbi:hypothetical protein QLX67_11195 [Balneolaceae bacterium ANBcel3]|nr:hypothetical protein [Balneolaceae bacterium ANBcel3]